MAKKKRPVPKSPAPRSVQAPRRREQAGPPRFDDERRKRQIVYAAGGSGVVALAVVLVVLAVAGGGGGKKANNSALAATLTAAGCTFQNPVSEGNRHVTSLDAKVKYKTFPPTSGSHYQVPAIWGAYTTPLVLNQEVHNLEHGGVIIQYGSGVPRATVDQLGGFYQQDPNGLLLAPLPALGNKIALTAWTHLATCTRYDEKAFKGFRDAYRYHGPENFPPSALAPGQ